MTRQLAGGQVDEFRLELKAGQFVHLVFEQQGVDVVSSLSDPENRLILSVDSLQDNKGSEDLVAVADLTGPHLLSVKAWDGSAAGNYLLRIESLRSADRIDRRRAVAARTFSKAQDLRREAQDLRREAQDLRREAQKLRSEGTESAASATEKSWEAKEKFRKAIEEYREAIPLFRELKDRSGEGGALRGLGRVYHQLDGQDAAAEEAYLQAMPKLREAGESWEEAPAVFHLGQIYAQRQDYELALEPLERALDLWRSLGRSRGAGLAAFELGKAHHGLGRFQEALSFFERSLDIWRDLGETPESTLAVYQRGESLLQLGKYHEALDDFEKVLSIWQDAEAHRWQVVALQQINQAYQHLGRLDLALSVLESAWEPLEKIEHPRAEAVIWNETGLLHARAERHPAALDAFEMALQGFQEIHDLSAQGVALYNIGNSHLALGDPCQASALYRQALELYESVLGPSSLTYRQTKAMLYLAKSERGCRGNTQALRHFREALAALEELRSRVASLDYRSSYLATQHWFYDEYVDLMMELHWLDPLAGYDAEALTISERARARSLLDGLVEGGADLRRGADPELVRLEKQLASQLQAIEQHSLSFDPVDGDDGTLDEQLRKAQVRNRTLLRRLSEVRARIHLENPEYHALTGADPLDAEEIRAQVLDPETLLLEYDLGDVRSYLWAVTADSLVSFELPPRVELERLAREAYRSLKLSKRRRSLVRAEIAMEELSVRLLGPVADLINGFPRLLVVSEGALQYIPFTALKIPGAKVPVVVEHEVVSMPSASATAVLRRRLAMRSPRPLSLAVIADPVFQSHDPRVRRDDLGGPMPPDRVVGRPAPDAGSHERLVYSQYEARAAIERLGERPFRELLAFEATREAVITGDLGRFQILHFATHGVLNEEHPELSHLVLSLFDESGRRRDGGVLFAHEIYNLDLPVELVVLSACETALGKEIRGEGLVGLTQSFFYAGAARVLVSLWNVDDYATAELMSRFYFYLIDDGQSPAAALRLAQLDLWKKMPAPYYWAAFVARGDWR